MPGVYFRCGGAAVRQRSVPLLPWRQGALTYCGAVIPGAILPCSGHGAEKICWDWPVTRWRDWWRVPCVKRNVIGAAVGAAASEMAMAGIRSVIPPDEVIDAMRAIGRRMDVSIRETGEETGLAATPTGATSDRKNCGNCRRILSMKKIYGILSIVSALALIVCMLISSLDLVAYYEPGFYEKEPEI